MASVEEKCGQDATLSGVNPQDNNVVQDGVASNCLTNGVKEEHTGMAAMESTCTDHLDSGKAGTTKEMSGSVESAQQESVATCEDIELVDSALASVNKRASSCEADDEDTRMQSTEQDAGKEVAAVDQDSQECISEAKDEERRTVDKAETKPNSEPSVEAPDCEPGETEGSTVSDQWESRDCEAFGLNGDSNELDDDALCQLQLTVIATTTERDSTEEANTKVCEHISVGACVASETSVPGDGEPTEMNPNCTLADSDVTHPESGNSDVQHGNVDTNVTQPESGNSNVHHGSTDTDVTHPESGNSDVQHGSVDANVTHPESGNSDVQHGSAALTDTEACVSESLVSSLVPETKEMEKDTQNNEATKASEGGIVLSDPTSAEVPVIEPHINEKGGVDSKESDNSEEEDSKVCEAESPVPGERDCDIHVEGAKQSATEDTRIECDSSADNIVSNNSELENALSSDSVKQDLINGNIISDDICANNIVNAACDNQTTDLKDDNDKTLITEHDSTRVPESESRTDSDSNSNCVVVDTKYSTTNVEKGITELESGDTISQSQEITPESCVDELLTEKQTELDAKPEEAETIINKDNIHAKQGESTQFAEANQSSPATNETPSTPVAISTSAIVESITEDLAQTDEVVANAENPVLTKDSFPPDAHCDTSKDGDEIQVEEPVEPVAAVKEGNKEEEEASEEESDEEESGGLYSDSDIDQSLVLDQPVPVTPEEKDEKTHYLMKEIESKTPCDTEPLKDSETKVESDNCNVAVKVSPGEDMLADLGRKKKDKFLQPKDTKGKPDYSHLLRKKPGKGKDAYLQQKIEHEIKMRDGTAKLLAASKHPGQMVEAAKSLLTSNSRMIAYMTELQKQKTDEVLKRPRLEDGNQNPCKAKVSLSDVRVPLMWKDVDHFKNKGDHRRFAVFCLWKIGTDIYDSSLVTDVDRSMTDITFDDIILFEDVSHNFECKLELYCHKLQDDLTIASTPMRIKKKFNEISSSVGRSVGKRLSGLKDDTDFMANMLVGPKFELIATSTMKLHDVTDTVGIFDLKVQKSTQSEPHHELPLFGHYSCRLAARPHCLMKDTATGFLQIKTEGSSPWVLYRCALKNLKISCWDVKSDSDNTEPQLCIPITKESQVSHSALPVDDRPHCFLVSNGLRHPMYTLSTDTKQQLNTWWDGLQQHMLDQALWQHACDTVMAIDDSSVHRTSVFHSSSPMSSRSSLYDDTPWSAGDV